VRSGPPPINATLPVNGDDAVTETTKPQTIPDNTRFADRMLPGWAVPLSWIFIGLSSLGWLSVALVALFFHDLVVAGGDRFMAPVLLGLGLVPVAAALVMEWGYSRALAGYRILRKPLEAQVRASIGVVVWLVLTLVHPLLGVGLLVGGAVNLGFARLYRNAIARDPLWDFNRLEAASFLAGRDLIGFRLASTRPAGGPSVIRAFRNAATALSVLVTLAIGSWLVAQQVLNGAAIVAALILCVWAVESVGAWLVLRECENPLRDHESASVSKAVHQSDESDEVSQHNGLSIRDICVSNASGDQLLTGISLDVEPGTMVGILGGTATGKSLFLQTLSDPYSLTGLHIRGQAMFARDDLWNRSADPRTLPAALLSRTPLVLHDDGMANLSCHGDQPTRERGRRILEQMLFSRDLAQQILSAQDARNLSSGQKKALGLARLFLLNPGLYLMDRPEDGASEALVAALCQRIQVERRAGRCFLVATDNRALLEMCDELIVMEDGRIIDKGPADDVRARMTAGWSRLVVERTLDAEDALQSWIRSHFRRDGDESNRRSVSIIASELLALSVQEVSGIPKDSISFDFKHQQGHCILRMRDQSILIGSSQIMKAERDKVTENGKTPPTALARIFAGTTFFEQEENDGDRIITVKVRTYDPRLKKRDGAEISKDVS